MAISTGGPYAAKTSTVKLMRSVKKVTLRLIEAFVERAEDLAGLASQHVPALMDPVLGDYARNTPDARWALAGEFGGLAGTRAGEWGARVGVGGVGCRGRRGCGGAGVQGWWP